MKRRTFLAAACSVTLAGCVTEWRENRSRVSTATVDSVEERARECERQYIRNEVITRSDEQIEDSLEPTVVETEALSDGNRVSLETRFGVTRSSSDAPDERRDVRVTARYLLTDEAVYRTDDPEGDPREGVTVDC